MWFFFSTSSLFVLVSPFLLPIGSLVKLRFFSFPYTLTVLRAARLTLPHWRMKQHAFFYTLINFIRAHSVSSQETVVSEMNQCMVMFRNPADQTSSQVYSFFCWLLNGMTFPCIGSLLLGLSSHHQQIDQYVVVFTN